MIITLNRPVSAANSATSGCDSVDNEIDPYIVITKVKSGEKLQIKQNQVKIRENQNGLMAVSYKALLFDTMEFERFFEDFNSSDKLNVNIGGTGDFGVNFRGVIEGKEKNFSQNIDHKILFLEEFKCSSRYDINFRTKGYSRFVPRHVPE